MDIIKKITEELNVKQPQVQAAVDLLDSGCTVPFVARYRKEATGGLNDEQLRTLAERLEALRNLEDRKQTVLSSIEEQGKLTDELKKAIEAAETSVVLEDLYRPYKQKRKTRATVAIAAGLEPLADVIYFQLGKVDMEKEAAKYISEEKGVADTKAALAGASDILAERLSDDADFRSWIREKTFKVGTITASAKDEETSTVYDNYYNYAEPISKITGYKVLALNRGEKEKILVVKIEAPVEDIVKYLEKKVIVSEQEDVKAFLSNMIQDSYDRLIAPSIEREIRSELTETAEDGAINVFGKNLTQLLMQPPIAGHNVLGWDPAFRTGCKLAVVDATGKVLDTTVIYPTAPTNPAKIAAAKDTLKKMIKKYDVDLISVGNGTASRESEQIIVELIGEIKDKQVQYVITNEAGASVYSASKLATEEFPNFDVGQRSAASIARRVQDPLAELVKIDPKSIGVGQYQHDMNQKKLGNTLSGVVEDCVNKVGVDLNTASQPLLQYISGISKTVAGNIVKYREENGKFKKRSELLKVSGLGNKAFEQCAGFLRIRDGEEALDNTAVHPESYEVARVVVEKFGDHLNKITKAEKQEVVAATGVGEMTLDDIISELQKPGRDPRDEMPKPVLKSDVLDMKDLKEGMVLKGTVRNVIDFGAFVDIGVHQDGLVHISQMSKGFVKHPLDVVSVGDIVEVKIISVDEKKGRIGLSMII